MNGNQAQLDKLKIDTVCSQANGALAPPGMNATVRVLFYTQQQLV